MQTRVTARTRWQVAGWSGLLAGALLLASLFQAGATNGTGSPAPVAPTPVYRSPATAALTDGDDVRARFLADSPWCCPTPEASCELSDGQPLYVGLHTCVAKTHWGGDVSPP